MSRPEVRISFDTEEEREDRAAYAKGKGLTLSALTKFALVQYIAVHPLSEAQRAGVKRGRGRPRLDKLECRSELTGGQEGGAS